MTTSTTHRGQRTLRDHAPQIVDSLLSEAEQATRLHRVLAPPPPAPQERPSITQRLADATPAVHAPSLLAAASVAIALVAVIAVAAYVLYRLVTGA